MKKEHILIVEDDENIRELLIFNLGREGYRASPAGSAEKALLLAGKGDVDLILLDLMLPGMSGLALLSEIKKEEISKLIPVIIVSAKDNEQDVIAGLDLGADDYITKPFSVQVLIARVKAVLRRNDRQPPKKGNKPETIRILELVIDPSKHRVLLAQKPIDLTVTEYEILALLARNPGRVFTRYQIVEAVRGADYAVTERSVDVLVYGLRKKLGTYDNYIETVRGIGYRFPDTDNA
jgi:two-component system alkaline phosphatase synthesis response regulator PhoP